MNDIENGDPSGVEPGAESGMEPGIPAERLRQALDIVRRMGAEIRRAVVGQQEVIDQVLACMLAGGHVLIEGVPGLGKTLLVRALAKTFAGDFSRIQFTPDLMPADVMGHAVFDLKNQTFSVRKGPVFAHLLLADEINRAPAKTQSSLLEVMQERQVTIEGESHPLAPPFMVLATQNPLENEGTYPLPEAQLDRFLIKVRIGYPSESEEQEMLRAVTRNRVGDALDVAAVATLVKPDTVAALQQLVARVRVDDSVAAYAVRLVRATRDWPGIAIGAGPRGSIALVRLARAMALLAGRDYATPDDIKQAGLPVLRHRIAISPESELDGLSADQLLTALLQQIAAPRA
ncbi:AAA family ATPase [Pseudoduganella namucuonensis]|uniref:MoxR-like ATPase n=1 Tax=Pseudoduganella namucuonensis TaxID=1035707 RepID=A0A1I7IJX0_9BURK|nr:MoxR family ATPase [Pseudoduganella namucuonensis]SFU73202.1 MoxR-like ATPase [Pseudoduganella namucuonensis]